MTEKQHLAHYLLWILPMEIDRRHISWDAQGANDPPMAHFFGRNLEAFLTHCWIPKDAEGCWVEVVKEQPWLFPTPLAGRGGNAHEHDRHAVEVLFRYHAL